MRLLPLVPYVIALAATAAAYELSDIKHVVLFMQENRAFVHYFKNNETELLPWQLSWQGDDWYNHPQSMLAGTNSW